MRRLPTGWSTTSPASLSTLRCCDTAGRLTGRPLASSPTADGRSVRRSKSVRLVRSPRADHAASWSVVTHRKIMLTDLGCQRSWTYERDPCDAMGLIAAATGPGRSRDPGRALDGCSAQPGRANTPPTTRRTSRHWSDSIERTSWITGCGATRPELSGGRLGRCSLGTAGVD